jgi:hypothetical protein
MSDVDPASFGMRPEAHARLEALYGTHEEGLERLFAGGKELGAPPHPKWEFKSKQGVKYSKRDVHEAIQRQPPELGDIDPRSLHSSQRGLTRGGVQHYMNDPSYEELGETYADAHSIGNRYPVILARQEAGNVTRNVLLSGHHRATKALLRGEDLRGIIVPGQEGDLTPHGRQ